MMRQGANSAIRFTTYTTLKQFVQGRTRSGQTLPSSVTFGMGAIAGLVTVYTTMPLECVGPFIAAPRAKSNCIYACVFVLSVIKTRMQSLEARAQYRNSFHCAYRIFTEEGLRRFWTGTTPRLARLVVRFLLPVLLVVSLSECLLDEWGHSLHDIRESHHAHWWARAIDTCNEYRHVFLYTPSCTKRPIEASQFHVPRYV
jgi:hypothetical protein